MPDLLLDRDDAYRYAVSVLRQAGHPDTDASLAADCLVESSLRGIDSHGIVTLLPIFATTPAADGATPRLDVSTGPVCVVDGNGSLGLRTARFALEEASRRATQHGVGAVAARNVGYLGALWWSVYPAATRGLIALAAVNSMACVAPQGGREPLHGTNPIAAIVPCDPEPIVLDMRTNALRMADYWEAVRAGGALPEDTVLAPDGTPVTDPDQIESAVYLPAAGARGYGLAILVDVLTAALVGGPIGREVTADSETEALSLFILALDPGAFGPRERFLASVQRLAEQAWAVAPLDPQTPVRLPGERAAAERRLRQKRGIPIDRGLWERHEASLAALGIHVPRPELRKVGR